MQREDEKVTRPQLVESGVADAGLSWTDREGDDDFYGHFQLGLDLFLQDDASAGGDERGASVQSNLSPQTGANSRRGSSLLPPTPGSELKFPPQWVPRISSGGGEVDGQVDAPASFHRTHVQNTSLKASKMEKLEREVPRVYSLSPASSNETHISSSLEPREWIDGIRENSSLGTASLQSRGAMNDLKSFGRSSTTRNKFDAMSDTLGVMPDIESSVSHGHPRNFVVGEQSSERPNKRRYDDNSRRAEDLSRGRHTPSKLRSDDSEEKIKASRNRNRE